MYYARPISTLLTFVTTSSPSFPLLFLSPFFPFPFLPFLSSFPSFPFLLFLSSFPSFLLFLSLLSSPFLSFFIFCGASQHRKSAVFPDFLTVRFFESRASISGQTLRPFHCPRCGWARLAEAPHGEARVSPARACASLHDRRTEIRPPCAFAAAALVDA